MAVAVDQTVWIYDIQSGDLIGSPLVHPDIVKQVAFGSGEELATNCQDNSVRLWDLRSGKLLATPIRHRFPVNEISMLGDNRLMTCVKNRVDVWTIEPESISAELMNRRARLLTARKLTSNGLETVPAEVLEREWSASEQDADSGFDVTTEQVSNWYAKHLDAFNGQYDWSSETFHRQFFMKMLPNDSYIEQLQAATFAENEQYQEAAECYRKFAQKDPEITGMRYAYCTLLSAAGDELAYQEEMDVLIDRYQNSEIGFECERLSKLLLLGNAKSNDSELPHRLAKKAYDSNPDELWFSVVVALADLRQGEFKQSIRSCDRVVGQTDDFRRPMALVIRGQAKHRHGDFENAKKDFEEANRLRAIFRQSTSGMWVDLAQLDLLIAELDQLLKSGSAAKNSN